MSAPPTMIVSLVRHAHVPSVSDAECTLGLSHHGRRDAVRVIVRLADPVDVVVTSSAEHACAAFEGAADTADALLVVDDDPRERELVDSPIENLDETAEYLWTNPDASHLGSESHAEAQARGVVAVDRLAETYPNRHVVVDIHATFMALVFGAYDPRYGREFWTGLTTPNVYEAAFMDSEAFSIARTWTPEEAVREGDADRDPAER